MALTPSVLRSASVRYGFAVVATVLAAGFRLAAIGVLGRSRPMATFFLATAVTSLVEGFGPGVLSLILGTALGTYLLIPPIYSFAVADPQEIYGLEVFWATGLVLAGVGEAMRRSKLRAWKGQEDLRREMAERQAVEASLRAHDSRFRTLIEHSSDVVTMLGADGQILYMSPSIQRVMGYTSEELVGESGFREIHPEDLQDTAEALKGAIAQPGVPRSFSLRVRHKDGSWRRVENVGTSFLDDPAIAAVVVNTRDVTERHAMEEQIRQVDARFRAFRDNSPTIEYVKDDRGYYVWGNFSWARQFGRPVAELMGLDDFDLWPEEVARKFQESDRRALESNRTAEAVETFGERHFMSLKFPLEHDGRRLLGGITLDVTDRVAAEEASRRSEAMLLALADTMPAIVWASRPDGQPDYFNRRWFETTGLSPEATYSAHGWSQVLHPDDVDRTLATWSSSVRSGEPYEIEYRFRDARTGGYRWHLGRGVPVRDEAGAIVRWYGTCADIDDQKNAIEIAERASQAKTRFMAVLSHELRTPLTPVLLSVSAQLDGGTPLDPEVRATLELARRNIALESRLIDDLLDVTQIARGPIVLHREPTDVHAVIARALEFCASDLEAAGLSLVLDLAPETTVVEADPSRLQQVVWNLVKNAVKFTPAGGRVAIRTRRHDQDSGRTLVVEVSDDGIGIAPEFLPRMFEAFEQAEASPWMRRYGGLGLGLAISRTVVEGHGGTLTAHSEGEGRGATFRVTLPVSARPAPAPEAASAPAPAAEPLPVLHILLIEDDPSTLTALTRLLRRNLHEVTTADCVAAAMEAADDRIGSFDLIISDIGLPDGNGMDLMRDIQARRAVPAIALTGYGEDEDIRRCHTAGFRAHLTKPIDFRKLEAAIKTVLGAAS